MDKYLKEKFMVIILPKIEKEKSLKYQTQLVGRQSTVYSTGSQMVSQLVDRWAVILTND